MAELGELRNEFSLDMQKRLVKILDDHKDKIFYYLLIHSQHDRILSAKMGRRAVRTIFMIRYDLPPVKLIGSACYYVNNRQGKIERLWALPLDIPREESIVTDEIVPEVLRHAKDMPIIH